MNIKVLAWNVHSWTNQHRKWRAANFIAAIEEKQPDVCFLSECFWVKPLSSELNNIWRYLQDRYYCLPQVRLTKFERDSGAVRLHERAMELGDFGSALLSKYPITSFRSHGRHMLEAGIVAEGGALSILGVHIPVGKYERARASAVERLLALVRTESPPDMIMGDFNTAFGETSEPSMTEGLLEVLCSLGYDDGFRRLGTGDLRSLVYTGHKTKRPIDYILVRDSAWRHDRVEVLTAPPLEDTSDHFPVLADIQTVTAVANGPVGIAPPVVSVPLA